MIDQKIKDLFHSSVEHVVSDISLYSHHQDKDFSRDRKISDALETVFKQFNCAAATLDTAHLGTGSYRFLAADGSTFTFFSNSSFSSDDYYYSPGKSAKGVYSMH